jgi:ABC-type transport system substrate-binding protein
LFKEWVRGDHLTLVKNPDYNWAGGVFAHNGATYLDELTFRFISEDATRTGTLESGETQVIELVPPSDVQTLQDSGFEILPGKAPGIPTVTLINTAKPPTDDLAVRKAILLGTDQQTIVETAYFGAYEPAHGPLAKVSWAYNPEVESLYTFDPEAAKSTLEEAGWTMNGDFREKAGQKLELQYVTTDFDKHSELWQAQMRDIGIDVKIQMVDNGTWIDAGSKGGQNVTPIGWISSDPVILDHLFPFAKRWNRLQLEFPQERRTRCDSHRRHRRGRSSETQRAVRSCSVDHHGTSRCLANLRSGWQQRHWQECSWCPHRRARLVPVVLRCLDERVREAGGKTARTTNSVLVVLAVLPSRRE